MQESITKCQWCGNYHQSFCPRVKSIEYHDGGIFIKKVEFFAPNDYPSPTSVSYITTTYPSYKTNVNWTE